MTAAPAAPGAVAAAAALPAPAASAARRSPKKLATASSCTSGQASSAACATRLRCRQRRYTLAAARATWPDSSARVAAAATLYSCAASSAAASACAPSSAFLSEASRLLRSSPWHKGRESGQFHPSTAGLGCASPHVRFLHLRCQAAVPCRSLPTPPTCAARALAASAARRRKATPTAPPDGRVPQDPLQAYHHLVPRR